MVIKKKLGEFERNTLIIFVLTGISGLMAYLYQIILGHFLSVEDYGRINILFTAISLATTIALPLCFIASRNIAIFVSEEKYKELDDFMAAILALSVAVCGVMFIVAIGLAFLGREWTKGENLWIYFGIVLVSNIFYNLFLYIVQGYKQFVLYGFVSVALTLIKCVSVVVIMKAGGGIVGALLSVLLANVICVGIMLVPTKKYCLIKKYQWKNARYWYAQIFSFYGWSFFQQVFITFITNGGDIILVKTNFSAQDAGYYSVTTTLCKVALFGVTPIVTAMFPEVAKHAKNMRKASILLFKTIIYGMGVICIYFVLLSILGEKIIHILYGQKYDKAVEMLLPTMICVAAMMFVHIFCQYYIAIGKLKIMTIVLGITILSLFLIGRIIEYVGQYIIAMGLIIMIFPIYAIIDVVISIYKKKMERKD